MEHIEFLYEVPSTSDTEGTSIDLREFRQKIQMFLNGDCSQEIKNSITSRIVNLVNTNPENNWVIGFIPTPDAISTIMRYGELALELGEKTDCRVYLDLFDNEDNLDDTSFNVNEERVLGNSIILIDSLFNTGQRYHLFKKKVIDTGAKAVYGIIVTKTT